MKRRRFLKAAGMVALSGRGLKAVSKAGERPNVVVIITDQQFADAMSCAIGSRHIHTPNMDRIAANGIRFKRAYCANPLCVPSRSSMFSGRYPHEVQIQTNTGKKLDAWQYPCMGRLFRDDGYDTGFFGKWHMPWRQGRNAEHGFDTYLGRDCIYSGKPAAEFIKKKRQKPFLAVASFMNPHNICEWARGQKLPGGPVGEPPAPDKCPPLKPNADPPANETDIISHMRRAYQGHRLFPVGDFTDGKWRQYRWAYYRLVEKVDRHVGTVLDAIRDAGLENDTLVVFLSDHGDCHGAHRWNQKTVFYDESARVPFIVSWKGRTAAGTCESLVHTGVDLIPTICDFANIPIPNELPGRSIKTQALGYKPDKERPYLIISNHMVQCVAVDGVMLKPEGRMVRSDRFKYCLYSLGDRRESLVDMKKDPGEMTNLATDPRYSRTLAEHRDYLREFALKHQDKTALKMLEQA